jgi:hypothetical protein
MAGVSITSTTKRNPVFFNFAGGDGQVTVAEKRASDRGVAARGTSGVTSGRDRCKRGKACGATCIAGNEDCIIDFPAPVQAQLQKMAQYIVNRRVKEGRAIAPGSEEDVQIGKAVGDVGRHLTKEGTYQRGSNKSKKETQERAFETTQFGQQRMISRREIDELKTNRDRIADAETNEKVRQAWQRDTQTKGVKLDRKSLEDLYDSLDLAAQQQLNATGSPGAGKFYGGEKDGKPITNAASANKERGLAVLDLYLKQGGTDAYGIGSTRVFSPADLDVEHIRPMERKKGTGGKDEPSNWVLARSGAQRTRSDQLFKDFIDSLPNTKDNAAMAAYYSDKRKKDQATRAMARISQDIYKNRGRYTDEEFLKMVKLAKPPAKKGGEFTINPIAKKVFLNEKGQQDGFFTGAVLKNPVGTGYATQPAGWAKAYLLVRKNNDDGVATKLRADVRDVWDRQWLSGKISTKEMTEKIADIYKSRLSPESWKLVEKDVNLAGSKLVKNYLNVGGETKGGIAPAVKLPAAAALKKMSISELENLIGRAGEAGNFAAVGKLEKLIEARQSPTPAKTTAARKKPIKPAAAAAKTPSERQAAARTLAQNLINANAGKPVQMIRQILQQSGIPGSLITELLSPSKVA